MRITFIQGRLNLEAYNLLIGDCLCIL